MCDKCENAKKIAQEIGREEIEKCCNKDFKEWFQESGRHRFETYLWYKTHELLHKKKYPTCSKSGKPMIHYSEGEENEPLRNCCSDCYHEWLRQEDIDF